MSEGLCWGAPSAGTVRGRFVLPLRGRLKWSRWRHHLLIERLDIGAFAVLFPRTDFDVALLLYPLVNGKVVDELRAVLVSHSQRNDFRHNYSPGHTK